VTSKEDEGYQYMLKLGRGIVTDAQAKTYRDVVGKNLDDMLDKRAGKGRGAETHQRVCA
jgi:hypothetical protein